MANNAHPVPVSIHAPLRGATPNPYMTPYTFKGFNPRTPAGCDSQTRDALKGAKNVSIHAPLRGATTEMMRIDVVIIVSIHAPLRGATCGSGLWGSAG